MSQLSRLAKVAARIEEDRRDGARTSAMIHRYEVGQLLRETVPVDDLIELSREIHSGDRDAETQLLEHVAAASTRWEKGDRPGETARELINWERKDAHRRLGDLRH